MRGEKDRLHGDDGLDWSTRDNTVREVKRVCISNIRVLIMFIQVSVFTIHHRACCIFSLVELHELEAGPQAPGKAADAFNRSYDYLLEAFQTQPKENAQTALPSAAPGVPRIAKTWNGEPSCCSAPPT